MATSGSSNYSSTGKQVIQDALRLIGVGVTGESLSAEEESDGLRVFNRMLKAWTAYGLQLWKREEISVALTEGKNKYTIGPSGADITATVPVRVLSAIRKHTDGGVARIDQLAYEDWLNLPDKDSKSIPVSFFFNPPVPNNSDLADLFVWPSPSATAASDWTLELVVQEYIEDLDNGTDDVDIPQYWEEAATYGLAYRLAPEYGLSLEERQLLARDTNAAITRALDWDVEWGSTYIQPEWQGHMGFGRS